MVLFAASNLVGDHFQQRQVNHMSPVDPNTLKDNEFRLNDIPAGSSLLVGDVAVFNVGGKLCATQNACTHRQGPLNEGTFEGEVVTCPWHGSQFNVCTGAVLRGPATDPLATYHVVVDGEVGRVEHGAAG
jgi:nitrite reductase/ring-hydroxylating ferredoxin subunit